MKLSRFLIWVVPLAAFCGIGLILAQVFWFRNAYDLKKEQFEDKVFVLLSQISAVLSDDDIAQFNLSEDLGSFNVSNRQGRRQDQHSIRKTIDQIFEINLLNTPYYYSISEWDGCNNGNMVLTDLPEHLATEKNYMHYNAQSCPLQVSFGSYSLSLFFPYQDQYLLRQTGGLLVLSLLLVVLLMSALVFALFIVHRQKKLSKIKNDFINNLSHEFKTPISSISLASKVLQQNVSLKCSKEDMNYLQLISEESKRLDNHVDKVLQMAILDTGNFDLEIQETNLHDIIKKVAASCKILLNQKRGTLELELNAENPVMEADPGHLFNLFYNLLDNAIKYSQSAPQIHISTTNESQGFCFRIKDNGIGIDEEAKRNIFEKFYRITDGDVHKVKGFGLGLSYVKTIVDAHRGKISIKSVLNHGSEFTILLPSI